jgi:hypothetical protein
MIKDFLKEEKKNCMLSIDNINNSDFNRNKNLFLNGYLNSINELLEIDNFNNLKNDFDFGLSSDTKSFIHLNFYLRGYYSIRIKVKELLLEQKEV